MTIVNHIRNRDLLLQAISKASEARAILDKVADINGQSRYFKAADLAHGVLSTAISDLTAAAAIETPELLEQRKTTGEHNWVPSPLEGN